METNFDYIIVGAGSAGCVVANRLSASSNRSVLLLEAGEDVLPGEEPADILDPYPLSSYNPNYFWPALKAHWNSSSGGSAKFPQARILGGGSAVAGMVAFRGTSDDYAEWVAAGASGWGWDEVLPYFRKLEKDVDFQGEGHGKTGPIPVRRIPRAHWPPLTSAIENYARSAEMAVVEDMNLDFREGFGVTPISSLPSGRVTTGSAYLNADVRKRRNLKILTGAQVQSLSRIGNKVVGVFAKLSEHGSPVEFRGNEVILSAGAIHSPGILMRAGIGDRNALLSQGIEVVADRQGVGRHLRNHAAVFVGAMLLPFARQEASLRTHPSACMRFSSEMPGAPHSDLYINIQSKTSWNAMGRRLASLNAVLLKPEGSGRVTLRSKDPVDEPLVEFGFGQNENDILRLATALGVIIDILKSDFVRPLIGRPYVVRLGDRIRKWNVHTGMNAFNARIYAQLLDALPQSLADGLLSRMTGNATNLDDLITEPEALVKLVKQEMTGVYHPVGTCRMGDVADPQAVVDADGRVIGVDGLRVVDASIMPTIPRGNTNIPTIMVAEKLSDHIIHESTDKNSRETLNWTFN